MITKFGRSQEAPAHKPVAVSRPLLQRACACGPCSSGASNACKDTEEVKGRLDRNAVDSAVVDEVPPIVHEVLRSPGRPLDPAARAVMESRFRHDFGGVRVHHDALAAASARDVNSLAWTVGNDIAFGTGRYEPSSPEGRRLLAHELAHVVQQGHSASAAAPDRVSTPAEDSEREASAIAASIERGSEIAPIARLPSALQRQAMPYVPGGLVPKATDATGEVPSAIAAPPGCSVAKTGTVSQVSWGETSGIYPTKANKYDPSQWDATKTCELLAARGAVHEVAKRGQKVHSASPGKGAIEQKLKPYHYVESFPLVDALILGDPSVKWFYLSRSATAMHTAIKNPVRVKFYGPFYNNGGGDVAAGDIYIHFFKTA